jgi:hypothetical protein
MKLLNLIFKTSTDGILSTFTKTISKLQSHASDQFEKAEKLKAEAEQKYQKSAAALAESAKANAAATKLSTFFHGE